jgi:DNA-binding response OmpR family regulator
MSLKYLGNINILIVEDDVFNLQLIRSLLAKISNINIISTDDGHQALNILELGQEEIHMVLLDLHLPQMTGKEILHNIRINRKFDKLPVLIISVDGMDEIELRDMGANDFILKPFDIDNFSKKIAANIQSQKTD